MTDRTSSARDLGDLLERLKARSGRSYESIARKIHVSKSTVHRYCTGASLPQEFGVLERIGVVCGASRDELVRLHQLWIGASADIPQVTVTAASQPRTPVVAERHATKEIGRRRNWARSLVGAVLTACLVVVTTASVSTRPDGRSPTPASQWVSGPAWMLPAAPVPSAFFGVTINSGMGMMPTFRVGAVRFWDSGTRWSEMQPQRGEFDWSVLDRHVSAAESRGLPALFVFGGTPRWASPGGPAGPYPDGSTAAPPDALADWDAFVGALSQRYRGRIEAYELWVLANDRRFYAGSVEMMVEMTRRASQIIRATDPKATLVCPGMGQLWTADGVRFLKRFAELGGYRYCDVAGIKLFQKSAADPPETMLDLVTTIDRSMHEAGVQPRLWNTGTTYDIPLQGTLDAVRARNYAVRFFLVGLYARQANLERMYFYNWGGTKIPIVLQAVGGAPTQAALAVEQLQRWLAHAESQACGHGIAIGLPENVWECQFTITGPGRTHEARIRWTDTGTAQTAAGPGAQVVGQLDGTAAAVGPDDTITLTEAPILIEYDR
jgi:hypothetical protein